MSRGVPEDTDETFGVELEKRVLVTQQKRLVESMTRYHVDGWTVRIWRQEEVWECVDADRTDLIEAVTPLMDLRLSRSLTASQIVAAFIDLDRVNAVEVIDSGGDGFVVYNDWP